MPIISPAELLEQLRDVLRLLAASADEQRGWLIESRFPVSELAMHLDMAWPLWQERLRETGMIDDRNAAALDELKRYVSSFADDDHENLFVPDALDSAPEWRKVRDLAREVEHGLRTPNASATDP